MKPQTSTPRRASIPSKMPRLVPTQMIVRRSLFATANAGYVSSGGGSSDGAFITAGCGSRIVPNGCLREDLTLTVFYGPRIGNERVATDVVRARKVDRADDRRRHLEFAGRKERGQLGRRRARHGRNARAGHPIRGGRGVQVREVFERR